jgi:Trp operon repressor
MQLVQKLTGLAHFFAQAKTEKEIEQLLSELLTISEIEKIHERIRILDGLLAKKSQRQVSEETGAAIVTVGRGAHLTKDSGLISGEIIRSVKRRSWWKKYF